MLYQEYLKKAHTCPFCEAKDRIFTSEKRAYLTYAKAPYHQDHLLVIPIRHVESFFDLTKKENDDINKLIKVGSGILRELGYRNFSVLVREGDNSNKSVKHLHYHLIPNNRIGDLDHKGRLRKIMSPLQITKLLAKINNLLAKK